MYKGTEVYNYISATELVVASQTSITSCTTTALPGLSEPRVYMVATHVKDVDGKDAILFTGGYKTVDKDPN